MLEELMPTIERFGAEEQLTIAHVLISRHYEELGRIEAARRHLSVVLDMYRSTGDSRHADMVRRALDRLDDRGGDP